MKQFMLAKVTPLGDYDEKYGQRYWCETEDQLTPVMFNSSNRNIQAGMSITAEEVLIKTSSKGTEYHGLKKVKVLGEAAPASAVNQMPTDSLKELLELSRENNRILKKLAGEESDEDRIETTFGKQDEEPIKLEDIPF